MAAGDPNPGAVAGMSWRTVREGLGAMPLAFLAAAGCYALALLAQRFVTLPLPLSWRVASDARVVVGWAGTLLFDAARSGSLTLIAVPVLRRVLLGEEAPPLFSPRMVRFATWLFAYQALSFVLYLLPTTYLRAEAGRLGYGVVAVGLTSSFIGLTVQLTLFYIWVRVGFVYPAVALDEPASRNRLRTAWALSEPRQWPIIWSNIVAFIPLYVVSAALLWVGYLSVGRIPIETGEGIRWGNMIVGDITAVIGAALGAATQAWNYRLATGRHYELTAETFA